MIMHLEVNVTRWEGMPYKDTRERERESVPFGSRSPGWCIGPCEQQQ